MSKETKDLKSTPANLKAVKPKARVRPYDKDPGTLYFFCPGCKEYHSIHTDRPNLDGVKYSLSGSLEVPTITPMISRQIEKFNKSKHSANTEHRCNSFITEGKIRFSENSTHGLAGKIADLPFVD